MPQGRLSPGKSCLLLIVLLVALSLYDLLSPHFTSPTIARQTQTAMLTENFVNEGFSLKGLYLNILGNEKPVLALEFPLYNSIVGVLFLTFSAHPFWGKLISLLASIIGVLALWKLARRRYGDETAFYCSLFFILSPLGVLMRTAFQPDATALMFVLVALLALQSWYDSRSPRTLVLFSGSLLCGGLAKYPLIIPYLPLIALAACSAKGRLRIPRGAEVAIFGAVFVVPFLLWYLYRGTITYAGFESAALNRSMFLVGDLRRFLSLGFYVIPVYSIVIFICSGAGFLFLLLGIRHLSPVPSALLLGIPLYFVAVPTAKDQHYYLFACLPICAFFMATGWQALVGLYRGRNAGLLRSAAFVIFVAGFLSLSLYAVVLRQDRVMWEAAQAVKSLSAPADLVFALTLHNRTAAFGGFNPTFHYLARRKGWNDNVFLVRPSCPVDSEKVARQVDARRGEGARWLVVSWYTPDIEPAVEAFIPASAQTTSDPRIDGRSVYNELKKRYAVAFETRNYGVLKL